MNLSLIFSFLMFSSIPLLDFDQYFLLFLMEQVEIKRTIPKGAGGNQSKDFKTKKIFVGGIPSTVTEGIPPSWHILKLLLFMRMLVFCAYSSCLFC